MQRYGLTSARVIELFSNAQADGDLLHVIDALNTTHCCAFSWCIKTGTFSKGPYLRLLVVNTPYLGKGLGQQMLLELEERVAGFASNLTLLVADFNERAQEFYRRNGYKKVGSLNDFVLPGVSELIFYKNFLVNQGS